LSLTHWKWTTLEDFISWKPFFVLLKHVVWVVAPCVWVAASRCFEETYGLHLQGLWDREFTHNPEDEGGAFLRNFGNKLPNHTAQQPRRPVSLVESSNYSFHVIKESVYSDCFIFPI
jgi:hypothetical protein